MQLVVNALLNGGLYAALAMGFAILYGVMNVLNIAHGAFIMLGAYICYWMVTLLNFDPFLTLPFCALGLFILGYVFQRVVMVRILGAGIFMGMIITYGLQMFLENVALLAWSSNYRGITTSYAGKGLLLGDISIPYIRLGVFFASCFTAVAIFIFMKYTRIGKAIKAVALNKYAASLVGINIKYIYELTFAIGAALAGIGGGLLGSVYSIYPQMGGPIMFKSFVVAVLGGLGNIAGVIVGGLVLSFAEVVGAELIGPNYLQFIGFTLMVIILCIRPQGIMGKRFYAQVTAKEIGS
jgi:branched-chain amino acid transport system permease protein